MAAHSADPSGFEIFLYSKKQGDAIMAPLEQLGLTRGWDRQRVLSILSDATEGLAAPMRLYHLSIGSTVPDIVAANASLSQDHRHVPPSGTKARADLRRVVNNGKRFLQAIQGLQYQVYWHFFGSIQRNPRNRAAGLAATWTTSAVQHIENLLLLLIEARRKRAGACGRGSSLRETAKTARTL